MKDYWPNANFCRAHEEDSESFVSFPMKFKSGFPLRRFPQPLMEVYGIIIGELMAGFMNRAKSGITC